MPVSGRSAAAGGLCGLAAGIVSGAILQVMWVLAPFALLLGRPPAMGAGWVAHLAMAGASGVVFGIVAGVLRLSRRGLLLAGMLVGIALFLVGPVLLVPAATGVRPESPFLIRWLKVGAVYLAFGAIMGVIYGHVDDRLFERRV